MNLSKFKKASLITLIIFAFSLMPNVTLAATANKPVVEKATVTRVVDGDTIEVNLSNKKVYKVRFIGVNTPESTTKHEPYGKEASAYTKKQLLGKTVYLEKDAGNADKYGRLLRYVWLTAPNSSTDTEIKSKMFNAILLDQGYAQLMTIPPNVKYSKKFVPLQKNAINKKRGLWGLNVNKTNTSNSKKSTTNNSTTVTQGNYVGNKSSHIFHKASCRHAKKISKSNLIYFKTRNDATKVKYQPCKVCKP